MEDATIAADKAALSVWAAANVYFLNHQIVGRVAATDIEAAKSNLAKVLELSHGRASVTIRVNPQQLDRLKSHCADLAAAMNVPGEVALVADVGIAPGGAKLVSPHGEIDATIRTQLDNVIESLFGEPAGRTRQLETANGLV